MATRRSNNSGVGVPEPKATSSIAKLRYQAQHLFQYFPPEDVDSFLEGQNSELHALLDHMINGFPEEAYEEEENRTGIPKPTSLEVMTTHPSGNSGTGTSKPKTTSPIEKLKYQAQHIFQYFPLEDVDNFLEGWNPELHALLDHMINGFPEEKYEEAENKTQINKQELCALEEEYESCSRCRQRSSRTTMFLCDDCKDAFHPTCIKDYLQPTGEDPRHKYYICQTCARDRTRNKGKKKHRQVWNSDSDWITSHVGHRHPFLFLFPVVFRCYLVAVTPVSFTLSRY